MMIKSNLCINNLKTPRFSDGVVFKTSFKTCVGQTQRFSKKNNMRIATSVTHLHSTSCPTAVVFKVPERVIDPFDFMQHGGSMPHVGEKVYERSPLVTDRNTSSSVVFKGFTIRLGCSTDHTLPANVLRTATGTTSMAMFSLVSFQTPTRFSTSIPQRKRWDGRFSSARTLTEPRNTFDVGVVTIQNCQSPKAPTAQIDHSASSTVIGNASARLRMSAFQVSGVGCYKISTLTYTVPAGLPGVGVIRSFQCSQFTKPLISQIKRFHMRSLPQMADSVQQWQS